MADSAERRSWWATLNLFWQKILIVGACLIAAIYAGLGIAEEKYGFAILASGLALAAILHYRARMSVDGVVLGLTLFGYLVGNRGFAQQTLIAGLPLFPAEFALTLGGGWLLVRCAIERRLPFQGRALHLAILIWIIAASTRLLMDLPRFHFLALRDFATVYYAGFFFVVQGHMQDRRARDFLKKCLVVGMLATPIIFSLFELFPGFFTRTLVFRGVPLVFLKSDVAVPMAAAGIYLLHFDPLLRNRRWAPAAALALVLFVFSSNTRAAQAGVIAIDFGLLFLRSRLPWLHLGALAIAGLLLAAIALWGQADWAERKLTSSVERMLSVADVTGSMVYESRNLGDKSDNNRFRLVWWRTVAQETIATNPVFGLGFGYDLARGFVREYSPTMGEDFNARSPHSIVLTIFGRMGFAGVLLCGGIAFIMAQATRHSIMTSDSGVAGLWCMAWVILVSACFGVVLEGPMGAVPFWIAVGLAYERPDKSPS